MQNCWIADGGQTGSTHGRSRHTAWGTGGGRVGGATNKALKLFYYRFLLFLQYLKLSLDASALLSLEILES